MKNGLEFLQMVKSWVSAALVRIRKILTVVFLSPKHVLFPKPKEPKQPKRKSSREGGASNLYPTQPKPKYDEAK